MGLGGSRRKARVRLVIGRSRGSGSAWGMAAPPSWDTQPYRQAQAPELRRLVRHWRPGDRRIAYRAAMAVTARKVGAPGQGRGRRKEGCSEGGLVVEVAAAFGLPLATLAAVAWAAFAGSFDLGGGELEAGPDLVSLDLGDRPLVALGGLPGPLAEPPGDHDAVTLGQGVGQVLGLAAPHIHLEKRGLTVTPLTILLDALGHGDPQVGDRGAGVGEAQLGGLDQVASDGGLVVCSHHGSFVLVWGWWLAFGAEPFWTTAVPAQFEMGGAGGVGGSVVLAGQPHDRVGVVLAAAGDRDAGAQREGGFPVAQGL